MQIALSELKENAVRYVDLSETEDVIITKFGKPAAKVVDVTRDDCLNALKISNDDFEDALVSVCAAKAQADYIVTRDKDFLKADSPVKTVTPDTLLSMLN